MTTTIGRLHDGRPVTLKRITHTKTEVLLNDKPIGYVHAKTQPQRDAITTQFVNARYGAGIARSIGFGNEDVFTAHNLHNRRISPRDYTRLETAAMAVAHSTN